jgi:hypothetical protein
LTGVSIQDSLTTFINRTSSFLVWSYFELKQERLKVTDEKGNALLTSYYLLPSSLHTLFTYSTVIFKWVKKLIKKHPDVILAYANHLKNSMRLKVMIT